MGVVESILYVVYRIYFYFRSPLPASRFGVLYNLTSPSPFENGTIYSEEEKLYEHPHESDDRIQIFAQNNKGQLLLAGIQRMNDGMKEKILEGISYCVSSNRILCRKINVFLIAALRGSA